METSKLTDLVTQKGLITGWKAEDFTISNLPTDIVIQDPCYTLLKEARM